MQLAVHLPNVWLVSGPGSLRVNFSQCYPRLATKPKDISRDSERRRFVVVMAVSEAPAVMKAWQYGKYGGGSSALEAVDNKPVPKPGNGELLIKIQAASVNPLDWKLQKGFLKPLLPGKFPCIPGTDVAGTVVEVGQGAGGKFSVGDRIVTALNVVYGGSLAEYAVAAPSVAAKLPLEVASPHAAGLPVAALTALQGLRSGGVRAFDGSYSGNVLVLAASGGVGHYAVQLAKIAGAFVTATCSAQNFDFVKGLGADEVLDYKTPEGQALASPSGKMYDIVLDGSSGSGVKEWNTVLPKLSPNGKVLALTPGMGAVATSVYHLLTFSSKRLIPMVCLPNAKDLEQMVTLLADGKVKTVIDSSFPLEKAPDAWAKSIDGHAVGKIVVTME